MKNFFSIACLSTAALAQSVAHISNASIAATADALNGNCCGANNLACACTEPKRVYVKEPNCVDEVRERIVAKMELKPAFETRTRQIQKTVMVPVTEMVGQIKTVQKPRKVQVQKQRVDHRLSTQVHWEEVTESVRIPVPKPECSCYSPTCSCVGQAGCGCCQPKCGCAPPRVQYATQLVTKKVPRGRKVKTPVLVPYMEEVTQMVDEHILHEQAVTKMVPKIILEDIEEIVPVYKEVKVETKIPYVVQVCKDELVDQGTQHVVKQLTFENVHQTHEDGDERHKHAAFSRSGEVDSEANPDMHSHIIHTNALAQ